MMAEALVDGLLNFVRLAVPTAFTLLLTRVNTLYVVFMYSKEKAVLMMLFKLKFRVDELMAADGLK